MTLIAGSDIETTGLNQAEGHRIIEICVSIYELETQIKRGSFTQRINPQRAIDPEAQAIHGIGLEELMGQPTWEEVAPKIAALLGKVDHFVAHNGDGFDLPFIYGELLRVGQPLPQLGSIDTMLQARWATADGSVPNLRALAFACGVPYDPSKAHAADYDVDVMMQCFFQQYPRGFFQLPTSPWQFTPMKPKPKKEKTA